MSRKVFVPLLAAVVLAMPAIESALAKAKNLNTSRSNIYRTKQVTGTQQHGTARTTTVKSSKSNTSDRMGAGGHGSTARTTTVKSSKSNSSDRSGGGGMGSGGFFFGR